MDFAYPPEADVYRKKVRSFLDSNLPKGWKGIGALNHADAAAFTEHHRYEPNSPYSASKAAAGPPTTSREM